MIRTRIKASSACFLVLCAALLPAVTAQAELITHGSTTITMDFVTVGNPNNPGDTKGAPNPCGSVGYRYSIGKYEVTTEQWAAVILADPNVGNAGSWSGSQPTGGASWHEAAKFCNWLTTGHYDQGYYTINGGLATPSSLSHADYAALNGTTYFLPTEDEWYKAAYYNGSTGVYYDYPTGSDSVPDGIDSAGDTTFDAVFRDPYIQGYPNSVTDAGLASPYGTIGQGGNLWEWNENETDVYGSRGLRGGSYSFTSAALASSFRHSDDPWDEGSYLGFRVSSVPEPGSIALLVSGGVVGLTWWWRRTSHGGRRSPGTTRSSSVPTPAVRRRRTRRGRGE